MVADLEIELAVTSRATAGPFWGDNFKKFFMVHSDVLHISEWRRGPQTLWGLG